jgi:hypothetical protein
MGGMGGLSELTDKYLMGGATEEFGTSVGVYEAGCGSLGQMLWSGTKFTGQLVYNAVSIVDGAKALSSIPTVLKAAPESGFADLLAAAQERYPNKAGILVNHHIIPKYLGGAVDGDMMKIDAAYHQRITNAFRREWAYGQTRPNAEQLSQILHNVYSQFPLPR